MLTSTLLLTLYALICRSLLRVVETRGTTFPVFAALAFDKISLSSVAALASQRAWRIQSGSGPSLASRSLWRSLNKLYRAWNWRFSLFLPTFAYVLSFPTWLSVMTGYQAQLTPYVGINGNLELATVLKVPDAVILDGSRIGLFDDYSIFEDQQPELYQLISNCECRLTTPRRRMQRLIPSDHPDSAECSRIVENTDSQYSNLTKPLTISNVSTADFQFSFTVPPHANDTTIDNPYLPGSSINLTSSISFNNETWTLKAPTLNIVANSSYYGYPSEYYAIDNHAYWADNLTITCEPAKRYQWGFSSQLLFTFCVLTIVFATALTSLHLDAYWGGRSDGHTRPTNIYRDTLDLAQELRKQLGVEVEEMSADELRELVNKRQGVIRLETDSLPLSRSQGRAAERRAITGSGRVPTGFRSLMGRRDSSVDPLRRHSTKLQVHYEELELQHDKGIEIHPFDGT